MPDRRDHQVLMRALMRQRLLYEIGPVLLLNDHALLLRFLSFDLLWLRFPDNVHILALVLQIVAVLPVEEWPQRCLRCMNSLRFGAIKHYLIIFTIKSIPNRSIKRIVSQIKL